MADHLENIIFWTLFFFYVGQQLEIVNKFSEFNMFYKYLKQKREILINVRK